MKHLIADFIELTNHALSCDDIFHLYENAIANFGYDKAVYTFVTDHDSVGIKAGHGLLSNYPQDWMDYYWMKNYDKIDPVVKYAFSTSQPFTWKELETAPQFHRKQLRILQEAKEAGLKGGMGIPLYGARGEIAGLGIASDTDTLSPDRNVLSIIQLLTVQFHSAYCNLKGNTRPDIPLLGEQTIEVLKWMAAGKTNEEIALILHCSIDNIKYHVKQIYAKLEVNSKTTAVIKAAWIGIIPPDALKY